MTTKNKLDPTKAIERFMEFIDTYNCQIVYRKDGRDADVEDGVLEEFREILAERDNRKQ